MVRKGSPWSMFLKKKFLQEPHDGSKRHVFKQGMPQGVSGRLSAQKKDFPLLNFCNLVLK